MCVSQLSNSSKSQAALSVAIVITDGRPQDDQVYPAEEMASLAKGDGIAIYTIGIGNHINVTQLQNIATAPHETHAFLSDNFEHLVSKISGFEWVPMICVKRDICAEQPERCHHVSLSITLCHSYLFKLSCVHRQVI